MAIILRLGWSDGRLCGIRRQGSEKLTYLVFLKMANERIH
jgi:hypothetical protein